MNKIEAAEALAAAVSGYCALFPVGGTGSGYDMEQALAAYRAASVPSDAELGKLAETAWNDARAGRKWTGAAAAVRQWVQRCGLTDDERERIQDALCEFADEYEFWDDIDRSIFRKLGLNESILPEEPDAATVEASQEESASCCSGPHEVTMEIVTDDNRQCEVVRERLDSALRRVGYELTDGEMSDVVDAVLGKMPKWEWKMGSHNTFELVVASRIVAAIFMGFHGLIARVEGIGEVGRDDWTVADAKAWCEQQLQEASE